LEFLIEYIKGAAIAVVALMFKDGSSVVTVTFLTILLFLATMLKIVAVEATIKEDEK
jgi:hypothetical protein